MISLLIILITAVISIVALNDQSIFDKLKFNAYDIKHHREGYRFFTHAFVHVDWMHLIVNMYVLWMFSDVVLTFFSYYFGYKAAYYFILLYVGGIFFSSIFDFIKQKDNISYNSVGASGAVASVVFASIILHPGASIYLFFIPIGIPAALFGLGYLIYSAIMARKANDHIGHNAHFWGSIFGIIYTILINPGFFMRFIHEIFPK